MLEHKMIQSESTSDTIGLRYFMVYLLLHNFGVHVRDKADGELAIDLAGNNSLGSHVRESPFNTMKGKRWVPPAVH